ncbi:MAG: HAMP domain-containing histidine kinase [Lachnospiraceae bacterium]|nr:HAMP domain-containing histidine kinase [Lachnospiraceae bacterium]
MKGSQKLAIIAASLFYVLTILAGFTMSLPYVLVFFVLFTLCMVAFAYMCYAMHNDYTGAEHLQQEIGMLKAEKEQVRADGERAIEEKNSDIRRMQTQIDDLVAKLDTTEAALKAVEEQQVRDAEAAEKTGSADASIEGLLPPDDEDPATTVDIIDVARRAIAELQDAARAAGLRVNISTASDKLMVHASAKRLLIMFRNIIDNSIKYMQTEGTLVVTISAIEDDIFIVLKDTGKGLPENETKHIFELNYQGSNRISGNGLGLTQAKAIVEHYGGTIYARSPEGSGMGIYIQLPTS